MLGLNDDAYSGPEMGCRAPQKAKTPEIQGTAWLTFPISVTKVT
jgi:hypothetical protein